VYVLGFEGMALIYASLFYVFYSTFLHFNIKLDYPAPIKYIFASPHLHRWHHAKDKKSMDKNYANLFSFFDVVFGSYYSPIESPEKYGIFERKNKKTPLTFLGQLIYPFKS
jgi:sterol desaturase/sphingolipid hydroxylase (fatty acid hydroxylase superfamily)